MKFIYDNIRNYYIRYVNRMIGEDDLNQIDFPRVPFEMYLKGLEFYLELEGSGISAANAKKIAWES